MCATVRIKVGNTPSSSSSSLSSRFTLYAGRGTRVFSTSNSSIDMLFPLSLAYAARSYFASATVVPRDVPQPARRGAGWAPLGWRQVGWNLTRDQSTCCLVPWLGLLARGPPHLSLNSHSRHDIRTSRGGKTEIGFTAEICRSMPMRLCKQPAKRKHGESRVLFSRRAEEEKSIYRLRRACRADFTLGEILLSRFSFLSREMSASTK